MSPGSAREALIAEAIGELSLVLDRLDGLVPRLAALQQELTDSGQRLTGQLADFEAQVIAITRTARTRLVNHIVGRTEDAVRRARQENSKAFADAARAVLRQELDRAVRHENWRQARSRTGPQVPAWLTHAGTALAASVLTWAVLALS